MAIELATAYVSISASAKGIGKSIQSELEAPLQKGGARAGEQAGAAASKGFSGKLNSGLRSIPVDKFLAAGAVAGAVKFAVNAASSLQESLSKTDAVFKGNAQEVKAWADTAASSFGQSKQQALEAASTFGNLFQAFGVGLEPATEMSTTLTRLASDLASFNNTSVQEAIEAIRSGLSGETEPLKRYGVALTDARLKQEALGLGLIKDVKAPLDAAAKSQAAYALIMKDTALAQGDFERTADGYANTMRTLQANVQEAAAALGTELLPVLSDLAAIASEGIKLVVEITTEGFSPTGNAGVDKAIRDTITNVTGALNPVKIFGDFQRVIGDPFAEWVNGADKAAAAAKVLTPEMGALSRQFASAHGGAAGYAATMQQVSNANNQVSDSVSRSREGVRTYGQVVREANAALQESITLQLTAVSSMFAVSESYRQFQSANEAAATAVDDSSTAVNEQQAAFDTATQAAIANAVAIVELDAKNQQLAGGSQSAKEKQDLLIGTLYKLASESAPNVASALGDVITKLQDTGKQKPKPEVTLSDLASGPLRSISTSLGILAGTVVTPKVRLVDEVTGRIREIRESLQTISGTRLVFGVPGGLASGVRNWRGGWTVVGEEGPELVHLPKGTDVYNAQQSAAMASGMGSVAPAGQAVVITGNTFIGSGPEVTKLLDARIREGRRAGVKFLGA